MQLEWSVRVEERLMPISQRVTFKFACLPYISVISPPRLHCILFRQLTLVHIAKCHSPKSWIISSYFPMSDFRVTACASKQDNRHNCTLQHWLIDETLTRVSAIIGRARSPACEDHWLGCPSTKTVLLTTVSLELLYRTELKTRTFLIAHILNALNKLK